MEKKILQRLKGAKHFPEILGFNDKEMILVMSHCGNPFKGERIDNINEQASEIADTLLKRRVRQLDESMNNNLLIKNGIIYMIDFDIACIDDKPMNNWLGLLYSLRSTDEVYRNSVIGYILHRYEKG